MKMAKFMRVLSFVTASIAMGVVYQNCADQNFDGQSASSSVGKQEVLPIEIDNGDSGLGPFSISATSTSQSITSTIAINIFNVTDGTNEATDLWACVLPPNSSSNPCTNANNFALVTQSRINAYGYNAANSSYAYRANYNGGNHPTGKYTYYFRRGGATSTEIRNVAITLTGTVATQPTGCVTYYLNSGSHFSPSLAGRACTSNSDAFIVNAIEPIACTCP